MRIESRVREIVMKLGSAGFWGSISASFLVFASVMVVSVGSSVVSGCTVQIPTEYTVHAGNDCVSPPPIIPIDSVKFSPACPYRVIDPLTGDTILVIPPGYRP